MAVTVAATDAESGVRSLLYIATGAEPIAATTVTGASTSISITAEGLTIISFYATDNAGNVAHPHQMRPAGTLNPLTSR